MHMRNLGELRGRPCLLLWVGVCQLGRPDSDECADSLVSAFDRAAILVKILAFGTLLCHQLRGPRLRTRAHLGFRIQVRVSEGDW